MRLSRILSFARKRQWFVYGVFWPGDEPLYVGMTWRPESRIKAHKGKAGTFEVLDSFPTKRMATEAELEYIRYLQPRMNTIGMPVIAPHHGNN